MLSKRQILRKTLKMKLGSTEMEYSYRMGLFVPSLSESAIGTSKFEANTFNELNIDHLDKISTTNSTKSPSTNSSISDIQLTSLPSGRKKVTFCPQVEVVLIPSIADLDPSIRADLWWDMTAFKTFTLCAYLQLRECMNANECSVREALTQLYQPSVMYDLH